MATPECRFILRENFDYDLYANRKWLPYIQNSGGEEEARVFGHILSASKIWVTRIEGVSLPSMPIVSFTEESLTELHRLWHAAVERVDYEQLVRYRNTRGEEYERSFGDIARHVVNHGSYHRGQIRGLFGSQGLEFPDTDFIGFTFERDHIA